MQYKTFLKKSIVNKICISNIVFLTKSFKNIRNCHKHPENSEEMRFRATYSKIIRYGENIFIASPNLKFILQMHMRHFGQFGLNGLKRGQTHFSQLHIYLDPEKLES